MPLSLSKIGVLLVALPFATSCTGTLESRPTDGAAPDVQPDAGRADAAGEGAANTDAAVSDAAVSDAASPDAGDDDRRDSGGGPDECARLTAEEYENNEGNNAEFTAKFFPTEDRDDEYIDMFFRSGAHGEHRYGAGDNGDLYTCDQCMLIVRNGSVFYPTRGSITIHSGSEPEGRRLVATLSELELIEIEISDSYHSIPVPGGECLRLAPATIDVR